MKIHHPIAAAILCAGFAASGARAASYTFTFTGPDFATDVRLVLTAPFNPGNQGFSGGPDQLWAYRSVSPIGGWPDFYPGGEQIALEATSAGNLFLTASSPFFDLAYATTPVSPSAPFKLSFPGFTNNVGTEIVPLVNNGYGAPGYGNTDILTIVAAPELASWGMMALGFAALGFTGYRRSNKTGRSTFA